MLGAANRRIGGALALAAELWLRLGRPVETGQALYRDARWADRTSYDLEALAREGNLGVLPLDPLSREIVEEVADADDVDSDGIPGPRLAHLLADYLAPEETAGADEPRRTLDAQPHPSSR
jgi:hypothetical protein